MKAESVIAGRASCTNTPEQSPPTATLPVSTIHNVVTTPETPVRHKKQRYYDACADQPWMPSGPAGWSWHSLALQIKNALHAQLHTLSHAAIATSLLQVIPADLSKLLAAVLICSNQGKDILWQSGITTGMDLINQLIQQIAGATTSAALLTSLPPLLLIWLTKQHVSLADTVISSLSLLLSSGLAICAAADFSQPRWLLQLDEQVITPISQLLADSGVTATVASGITLVLGCYVMLRVCGGLTGKIPQANVFNYGLRIIGQISQLCSKSRDYQRQYQDNQQKQHIRRWYEDTYRKPYQQTAAATALQRAVIRCLPDEILHQRETLSTAAFHQAYQDTEQRILQEQRASCPDREKNLLPPGQHRSASSTDAIPSSASTAPQRTPLLLPAAVAGAVTTQSAWWPARTTALSLAAVAAGSALLAGARYLRDSVSGTAPQAAQPQSRTSNICLEMINKIRFFLSSDSSGPTLAAELFNYLFDTYGNLRIQRASRYLDTLEIKTFNATARDEMNEQLRHTLSLLWSQENNHQPVDVSRIIINLEKHIFYLWAFLIKNKRNIAIKTVLKELRLYCAKEFLSLGIYSRLSMEKITNFLLSLAVPDLLLFEYNGLDHENVISKKNYHAWNYIGWLFIRNHHLRNNKLPEILELGEKHALIIARIRSYPNYVATKNREELEETYKELNKELYRYQKLDIELEAIPFPEFTGILEVYFPGIDLYTKKNFNNYSLRVKTQGRIEKEIRILQSCQSLYDVMRNFEDGLKVLLEHAPREVPEKWRIYDKNNKTFTLRPHLKRSEMYQKFDTAWQQMAEKHCTLYGDVLDNAFKILPDEDVKLLHSNNTEIYSVSITVKRRKVLRTLLMPTIARHIPDFMEKIAYNNRPYYSTGMIFIAYNPENGKKVFYAAILEISREESGKFPVWRLPINSSEEILTLDKHILETNFLFADQQPLLAPCPKAKEPKTTLLSHWREAGNFFDELHSSYTEKLCEALRHPEEIKVSFQEKRLGDSNTPPLVALKQKMIKNREQLLGSMQEKALGLTEEEKAQRKGAAKQMLEMMPLHNCYDFLMGLLKKEDTTPPSFLIRFFEAAICVGDVHSLFGISALLKSLKIKYTRLWLKKHESALLHSEVEKALKRTTPPIDRATLLHKVEDAKKQLDELDSQITELRNTIYGKMLDVYTAPLFLAFPYLSFGNRKKAMSANMVTWGISVAKASAKKVVSGHKNRDLKYIWHNPSAGKLIEYEHYYLPYPDASNSSCHTDTVQSEKVTLNIFELRHSAPDVYKKLHFTALRHPSAYDIITTAKDNSIIIPEEHNQMAIYCFTTFTIPVRFYSSMILSLEENYKQNKNDIKMTQEALYQFYDDVLERPYITPPVELQPEQKTLIEMSLHTLTSLLKSTIQGIEATYLFMIHYFFLYEDINAILQEIQSHPNKKEKMIKSMQRDLTFTMEKFTLYGSVNSAMQEKFYAAVVERYLHFCQQTVSETPWGYMLFSPTIDIFLQRQAQYHAENNDASAPLPADYIHHWQRTETLLLKIYESFARIEYSAQVLATFPPAQWLDSTVQKAWLQSIDSYLFPEMRYEKLLPVLRNTTQELRTSWMARRDNPQIIDNNDVNPLFITDVRSALQKVCPRYPNLFFCMVYQIDDGRWFTPLNNDFISESQIRSTREAHAIYPAWTLPDEPHLPLNATLLSVLRPLIHSNSNMRYQQYLSWVLQSFLRDNALPFHQRWQGHFTDSSATSNGVRQSDAIALIHTLIDPQGNIIDYQLAILRRHLPQAAFSDYYPLLQLLSDMLHMTRPDTVPLYRFIRHHLQKTLTRPELSLSTLQQNSFIVQQASEIQHAFISTLNDASPPMHPALQRYTLAAVRHLLSFARFLPLPDPLLAATPLHNLAAQWLNLGAIIAQQLRLKTATAEDLLALSWAAQHDAGLLSLRETGIQQLALLSGNIPTAPARNEAQDALNFIVLNLHTAAEIQQRLYHCAEASQLLSLQLHDLVYSAMNAEQQDQLRSLASSALQKQRDLLHIALQQLSVSDKLRLSQWQQQGKLDAIWYPANDATHDESKIIGFAFAAENQPRLFLPVAEPLYMPLIFRQLAANADEHQLQALCFGRTATGNPRWLMMPAVSLNLASPSQDGAPPISDPADILHTLMEAELASLLARLTGADGEIHFERQKLSLMEWLVRHLFFFDRGGQQDYRFIFGQAQRMASIVAQSHLQHEPGRADAEGIVNPFSQTIRRIMGATTVLPDLVSQLAETTPLYGATAITSLNTNGFSGFWWDPFSQLCYLGWKKGNSRTLYASTPENRYTLYKLADDNAAAEIWPMLVRSDGLKGELQALLHGTLSNEQFFADALPTAWHLHGALAGASPLPAGAIQHATLSDVWFTREAGTHYYLFSPSGSDSALPVTLETLSAQSYRLHFSPSDGRGMADQGFTLETRPFGIPGQHHWQFIPATSWQLVSAPKADALIRQGQLSPEHYLQWGTESGNPVSIRPDAHVLQRSDGCMVFTFHDEHASQTHYRLLDTAGTLQLTTTLPAGWSLLTAKELQFVSSELQTAQRNRLTAITTASALIVPLPFRYTVSSEAQDEWHNINIHLRAAGRNFFNEVWQRAQIAGPLVTVDELLWLHTDWRATDFYQTEACDNTLKKLAQQQQLLKTMLDMLKQQHDLRALSEELQRWLHQLLHHSQHASTALQLVNAQRDNRFPASDAILHLHRQHFAQNYFFSHYNLQLHATADLFLQSVQCIADDSAFTRMRHSWQPALNQLHLLAGSLPQEVRLLDRLLALPDRLWLASEMQQRTQQWQQICQPLLSYWRTPRRAENITLLRPVASSQELTFIPQHHQWPVRLLLSAGKGRPVEQQMPAWQLSPEQQEDLLLLAPEPPQKPDAPPRLAGINAHPRTAHGFVAWAKLRLSTPWALAEFSGPAFLARLQLRMQSVIAGESASWTQEERDFYQATDSEAFLLENDTSQLDKHRYAAFFRQLFNSDLLVTRLVMSDVEMLFALLCERFIEQHPKRATEDISRAWFLFLHSAESAVMGDDMQSLYLIGI